MHHVHASVPDRTAPLRRRRLGAALGLVGLVGLAACGGGGSGAPAEPVGPSATAGPVRVNDKGTDLSLRTGFEYSDAQDRSVAIDGAGRVHVIWWDPASGLRHGRSTDGGATFLASVLLLARDDAPLPYATLAASQDHPEDVYVAYRDAAGVVRLLRSTDGGATWPAAGVDTGLPTDDPTGYAVAAAGDTVLVTRAPGTVTARSTDRGATFQPDPAAVLNHGLYCEVLADPRDSDRFVVLAEDPNVLARTTSDGGVTWGPQVDLRNTPVRFADFGIDGQGRVFGAGDGTTLVVHDVDAGTTTAAAATVASGRGYTVAVDRNGRLHLVSVVLGVLELQTSDDGAATLEPPVPLDVGVVRAKCAASPRFRGVAVVYERDGQIYYQHD